MNAALEKSFTIRWKDCTAEFRCHLTETLVTWNPVYVMLGIERPESSGKR